MAQKFSDSRAREVAIPASPPFTPTSLSADCLSAIGVDTLCTAVEDDYGMR
jgi:hypothetical protein